MKAASRISIAIALGTFAIFAAPRAHAQSEIAPDHFDSPNMVPFDAPRATAAVHVASVQYSGKVTLAHRVRVNGRSLAPGDYAVSMRSDGKTVELRLNRRGENVTTEIAAYHNALNTERGYLVVERRGNARRVSVIHAGQLQLVFAPETDAAHRMSGAATLEVLPLAFTVA